MAASHDIFLMWKAVTGLLKDACAAGSDGPGVRAFDNRHTDVNNAARHVAVVLRAEHNQLLHDKLQRLRGLNPKWRCAVSMDMLTRGKLDFRTISPGDYRRLMSARQGVRIPL
jgi:hypothetical protein